MFGKIKDAARQAQAERALLKKLQELDLEGKSRLSLRIISGKLRATIVLAESVNLSGDEVKALEAELANLGSADKVTLVATHHESNPKAPPKTNAAPAPSRVQGGHDNPLALPGAKKVTDADRAPEMRARPQRQRPGGAKRILAVASGKGGVGKTTIAAHIALALAARGDRVGLLDLDIYGPSLPVLFGLGDVRPEVEDGRIIPLKAAGISLMSIGFLVHEDQALAWRGPMVMGAAKQLLDDVQWPELDWIIIDTPPGTGDTHLTLMQRTRIDGAVIVSTPSPLAIADVRRGASLFRKMDVPILGLVENMSHMADGSTPFGVGISPEELVSLGVTRLASLPLDPSFGALIGQNPPPAEMSARFTPMIDAIEGRLSALDQDTIAP